MNSFNPFSPFRSGSIVVTGGGYDADAITLFGAMTSAPDATRMGLISDVIAGLKTAAIWTALDEFWVFAAHSEQASWLGWKRLSDCTPVNSPTVTTDRGFQADSAGSRYAKTGLNLSTLTNYTQDSATMGVYSRTDLNVTTIDMGARVSSSSQQGVLITRLSGQMEARLNLNTSSAASTNADSLGLHSASRTASNSVSLYKSGSLLVARTPASAAPPNLECYIGASNTGGSAANISNREYAFACLGGALDATQHAALYSALQTYLTALGAAV
jgi:hypothetical protein